MRRRGALAVVAMLAAVVTMMTSAPPVIATGSVSGSTKERARYFVLMKSSPQLLRSRSAVAADQLPVLQRAVSLGGDIHYRYSTLINAFSADLSVAAAGALQRAPGVDRVVPVSIVRRFNSDSVPFIGADVVRKRFGLTGKGVTVAVVDTGVDYTHASFNGKGTRRAYRRNDPDIIEPGTFPTKRVVGGYDFVGDDYDPLDKDPGNDAPVPDDDPLDIEGHGTHVAGTCCGKSVPGSVGRGVAPRSKILAYKVWGPSGSSTSDVLVAAYERAVDPDGDGDTSDRADVLSFSGGVNFGTEDSIESIAAQAVVDAGTVFVAAAGNSGGEATGGLAYRVGAPATAPGVVAVAASTVPQDTIAGFSSQGPARYTSALKPDLTTPGVSIVSARVGSGDGGTSLSGTSMATPHVSGAAALLLQRFPGSPPAQIKALMMNGAVHHLGGPEGSSPDASLEGAGRVDLAAAASASFFVDPPSLSFGVTDLTGTSETESMEVRVTDLGDAASQVKVTPEALGPDDGFATVLLSDDGVNFSNEVLLDVESGGSGTFWVKLRLEGNLIGEADQARRWYAQLLQSWGGVKIRNASRHETARVVWHTVPNPVSRIAAPDSVLIDPATGMGTLTLDVTSSAGIPYADLYQVATTDLVGDNTFGEADIVAVGARSFVGTTIGDGPEGLPSEEDLYSGLTWRTFVKGQDNLREPLEFVAITERSNETIESATVRFYLDVGADGNYVDEELQADFMVTKDVGDIATWCLADLEEGQRDCSVVYAGDYAPYLTHALGVVVDATDLGLTSAVSQVSVRAEVCSDPFSGDVLAPRCDESDPVTIDVVAPAITFESLMCDGFWSAVACTAPNQVGGEPGAQGLVVMPNQPDAFAFFVLEQ